MKSPYLQTQLVDTLIRAPEPLARRAVNPTAPKFDPRSQAPRSRQSSESSARRLSEEGRSSKLFANDGIGQMSRAICARHLWSLADSIGCPIVALLAWAFARPASRGPDDFSASLMLF